MAHAASHHHHVEPSGEALAAAARDVLIARGEQWTDMRAVIYNVLAERDRPASAYDIADAVSQRRGKRVAANSVYRILDLFVASNLAMRIESVNAFIVNAHPGCRHDCIFLVCRQCGEAQHVDDDHSTAAVREVAEGQQFATERPVIEILGRCRQCAG